MLLLLFLRPPPLQSVDTPKVSGAFGRPERKNISVVANVTWAALKCSLSSFVLFLVGFRLRVSWRQVNAHLACCGPALASEEWHPFPADTQLVEGNRVRLGIEDAAGSQR